ncbi:MAG: hypothetical protein K2M17_05765 [Bacilli bacterium]|nr:hypothetical protein [Bacilli bacterium]
MYQTTSYAQMLKLANVRYLGDTRQSTKLIKSYVHNCETYGIYLAPSTLARDNKHPHINTCPFAFVCKDVCLNKSGQNKLRSIKDNHGVTFIDKARIRKTHLFYDNRALFMEIMVCEIMRAKKHAEKHGKMFAVRLNCTSDLSPELFTLRGKNILELFPDVQFYDYTKVPSRLELTKKYNNYYVVFSYDGTNWAVCNKYLSEGGNVAVVFDLYDENGKHYMPTTWRGYTVKNCDNDDIRFMDNIKGGICGLTYHKTSNDYRSGKYKPIHSPMIVRDILQ